MLIATTFAEEEVPKTIGTPEALIGAQHIVRHLPVGEVVDAILRLVRAARPDDGGDPDLKNYIAWGPGPRASQAFMLAVRAKALIEGRLAPYRRRRGGAGATGSASPHGAQFFCPRRRHDDRQRHRSALPEHSLTDYAIPLTGLHCARQAGINRRLASAATRCRRTHRTSAA